ncbi:hypothetical protein L7F22_007815 [Adiantum nelumboides]|nr:hypothetical protein [Adiantum nelumboides]
MLTFLLLQMRLTLTASSFSHNSTSTDHDLCAGAAPVVSAPPWHSVLIFPEKQQLVHKPAYLASPAAAVPCSGHPQPLRLPLPAPINCPFPVRLHPDYHSVIEECNKWGLSLFHQSSSLPEALREAYLGCLFPLLPAAAYPSSLVSERRLVLCIKHVIWHFWLDDSIGEADAETAAEIANAYVSLMSSPRYADSIQYVNTRNERVIQFMERFRVEVWDEIRREMSPDLERRFATECVRSIEAMKKFSAIRSRSSSTDPCSEVDVGAAVHDRVNRKVQALIALRLIDIFCWPYTTLLEYALGIELPDPEGKTAMGRLVQKMVKVTGKQVLLVNELLSCGKEFGMTDMSSLAGALLEDRQRRPAGDKGGEGNINVSVDAMQEVLREIWGMIQEEERMGVALVQEIRSLTASPQAADTTSVVYSKALCHVMSGNLYWTTLTWRYNGRYFVPWNTTPAYVVVQHPMPPLNFLSL